MGVTVPRSLPVPIPPRVSVVALRTVDLVRSTAFYQALGWELSPASTPAMSLFRTAGSLLLLCTDDLLAELGGDEVAAALPGEPNGGAVLSIHVATDEEVAAAVQEAAKAGGAIVRRPAPTPLGGSYAFFADPDGHLWEVIHHPLYRLGDDGRPEVP
jgi:catechol 2,3-dioxygenase-like lactoylglutathione lyase family enzyme